MRSALIVEANVSLESGSGVRDAVVGPEINLLVLDGLPQAFNEQIVPPAAFAVHRDADLMIPKHRDKVSARKLRALIGVEDLRLAIAIEGFLQGFDTEVAGERVR